ncbi:helix-turn-helix domain-containing protein [Micromonospora sp. DT47]|uniref:helix-turn-helix domain-containing protein n=1 Tax=Micromonospora sp. DT47 TaxID=3393431 RepID=UPI003CE6DBEC
MGELVKRAYKYRCYPSPEQADQLNRTFGAGHAATPRGSAVNKAGTPAVYGRRNAVADLDASGSRCTP